jgi:hypothetical protein
MGVDLVEAGRRLAEAAAPYPWVYATFDGANEAHATGVRDLADLVTITQAYRDAGGTALITLTSPPTMQHNDLLAMCRPPADLYEIDHANPRVGRWYDKVRRSFNAGYESGAALPLPVGIQSEGIGPDWTETQPGQTGVLSELFAEQRRSLKNQRPEMSAADVDAIISVAENLHEMDAEAVGLITVASFLGGVLWVWFSGEGVWHRRGLAAEAGFAETPALIRSLPPDLLSYETVHHSGERWVWTRVFFCDEPDVRIDGRLCSDGRFAYVTYGPSGLHVLRVERPCEVQAGTGETWTLDAGVTLTLAWARGRVLQGRIR